MSLRALVLRAAGTNCDVETSEALRQAGALPETVHINKLLADPRLLDGFDLMVLPGGFSYGDDVAAGKILANELRFKLGEALERFIDAGRRVVGICNGFQVLVKAGFLPGTQEREQTVTLTANESGLFQCEWIQLKRQKSVCAWLEKTDVQWDLPIAHGEGKFVTKDAQTLATLEKNGQVVWRYTGINPNGSVKAIAGICNTKGNVVGLMPHPERHLVREQHPEWTRQSKTDKDTVGLQFFKAAVYG